MITERPNTGDMKMDKQFELMTPPKWLKIVMTVCKGLLILIPFTISSIMLYNNDYSLIWNCIWMLSLLKIIDYADER